MCSIYISAYRTLAAALKLEQINQISQVILKALCQESTVHLKIILMLNIVRFLAHLNQFSHVRQSLWIKRSLEQLILLNKIAIRFINK